MENNRSQTLELVDRRPDGLGSFQVLPDELICGILDYLAPRDVSRLACVSSVMYILCNEEPLWMGLCLNSIKGPLEYKGSWKKTTLFEHLNLGYEDSARKPLHFDGFNSLFLYRRLYRCYTSLDGFNFDNGNVERKKDLCQDEFHRDYDGKKPVLISGLADTWPARTTWTSDRLLLNYGDTAFNISQKSSRKVSIKFKDYVSYMKLQHDEDPLYIFDDKFGEVEPELLKDYKVPHLFEEDFFDVLERDQRPPFRWLIIGPERSGASWHVDPALTSAWNTLLCGRKRWALYPPGKVPLGVTVHVNEEDGDVNVETPSSLQWWLDFYPLLAEEDKPIECTQLPGETIFVPSGWWHCVLNLETTIAVTQNFVNSKNLEFVCLDMAPGYRHKGICRAGYLALHEKSPDSAEIDADHDEDSLSYKDCTRKEKRVKIHIPGEDLDNAKTRNGFSRTCNFWKQEFSFDITLLASFLDEERDHYNQPWSSGNCMGQREMREWLTKLWVGRHGKRELIWKGACLALNASKWLERAEEICAFHKLPTITDDERLPVGTGSNPVYLLADCAIKIFVEGGLEASIYGLGTELEFYGLLSKVNSSLKNHIPDVLGSGIIYLENGFHKIIPWDGRGIPDVIAKCNIIPEKRVESGFPFGIWNKKQFEYKTAGMSTNELNRSAASTQIWPYIITKRCKGKIFAQLRDSLSLESAFNLASFLGEQLRNLHLLPLPPYCNSTCSDIEQELKVSCGHCYVEEAPDKQKIPAEWDIFLRTLTRKKKDAKINLTKWGNPIPSMLIDKIDEYIPDDFGKFLEIYEDEHGLQGVCKPCSWIHGDIMDDNIHMEPCALSSCSNGKDSDESMLTNGSGKDHGKFEGQSWNPSYILDFSDLSIGDPISDLIPLHLDVFRGDLRLLQRFLESYKLPLLRRPSQHESVVDGNKFGRLSYHTMCYCILHDDNVLGAIFGLWKELQTAKSWEEVEQTVWGELNSYKGFS